MQNQSGISPTEYKVLVKPDIVAKITAGGVHIPETKRDQDQHAATTGILVAISPIAFTFEETTYPRPKVGDRVVFQKYIGSEIQGKDKEFYRLLNDRDIYAVLEAE